MQLLCQFASKEISLNLVDKVSIFCLLKQDLHGIYNNKGYQRQ